MHDDYIHMSSNLVLILNQYIWIFFVLKGFDLIVANVLSFMLLYKCAQPSCIIGNLWNEQPLSNVNQSNYLTIFKNSFNQER
jgi:hypothetical protein